MVAVTAMVDEADLRVEAFELRVRQSEIDGGEDPLPVGLHRLGQLHEGGDPAPLGPAEPPVEVLGGVRRPPEPIEIAKGLFELPAPVEGRGASTKLVEDLELAVGQVRLIFRFIRLPRG